MFNMEITEEFLLRNGFNKKETCYVYDFNNDKSLVVSLIPKLEVFVCNDDYTYYRSWKFPKIKTKLQLSNLIDIL